jgi:hydrogenase nickel incorporation protein HypA/HybF
MQEQFIAQAILDTALRHSYGRRVRRIRVRLGALRQVVPSSLSDCFEELARDTDCSSARLELESQAGRLSCADCGATSVVDGPPPRCRECASDHVTVVDGGELLVESIQVETTQPAVI